MKRSPDERAYLSPPHTLPLCHPHLSTNFLPFIFGKFPTFVSVSFTPSTRYCAHPAPALFGDHPCLVSNFNLSTPPQVQATLFPKFIPLTMQNLHLLEFFSRSFSMSCASFSMLDSPGPQGPSSIENDAHAIEKLLLKKLK